MPPWWYMPIKTARVALKMIQVVQKMRDKILEVGTLMLVRMRGTVGRRNRGSWWGNRLRKRVPVAADDRRLLLSIALRTRELKG